MLAYKGIKKKDDLVRTLRERGYRDDLADPIVKWKNKDLVQALMKSDLERDGDSMEDAGAPGDKESDDEDSEDDSSSDEGDDEEAADEAARKYRIFNQLVLNSNVSQKFNWIRKVWID